MKNWLNQKTTWLGLFAAAIAGLEAYQSGGTNVTVLIAVLSALGLLLKDTQK